MGSPVLAELVPSAAQRVPVFAAFPLEPPPVVFVLVVLEAGTVELEVAFAVVIVELEVVVAVVIVELEVEIVALEVELAELALAVVAGVVIREVAGPSREVQWEAPEEFVPVTWFGRQLAQLEREAFEYVRALVVLFDEKGFVELGLFVFDEVVVRESSFS